MSRADDQVHDESPTRRRKPTMNQQSQQRSLKAVILSNLSYLHSLLRALKSQTSLLLLTSQPRRRPPCSLRPHPISQPRPCLPPLGKRTHYNLRRQPILHQGNLSRFPSSPASSGVPQFHLLGSWAFHPNRSSQHLHSNWGSRTYSANATSKKQSSKLSVFEALQIAFFLWHWTTHKAFVVPARRLWESTLQ